MNEIEEATVRGRRISAAVLVLLTAAAVSASAETWKGRSWQAKMRRTPWHFGPFHIQPQLILANVGVDSNVFYSPSDPVKDFTLTAGPAATIYLPIHRKFVLSAYGSPQYVWYSKTVQERTWNYYFNGAAQLSLKNVFLSLDAKYSDARERYSTEIDIRPRRKEMGYGGSALVKLAHKTSFSLAARIVEYDYESAVYGDGWDVREKLNRQERYANLSFYHQSSSQRRFFLDFEYGEYAFEFSSQAAISDSRSAGAYAGLEFSPLGRRVRGRIRLGYKKFDVLGVGAPIIRASSAIHSSRSGWPSRSSSGVSYVRDVVFSLWYDNPYYLETRPGVGASVYVLRFLRFDYDYSRGRNEYPLVGGGGPDVKRYDIYEINRAGMYFRLVKSTAIGIIANWWARDSNIDSEDDNRTFFGLNLTYDF